MRFLAILFLILMAVPSQAATADRVIFISVDGLRADLLDNLLVNDSVGAYANFQRLVDEGASTFNARTDYTHTVTLPNHTTMITGRPVLQPAGQPVTVYHGYTSNSTPGLYDTLHNVGNPFVPYIASVFDVIHDHGMTTAMFASKSKFIIFDRSYDAANGAPDITGSDNGPDKIDQYFKASSGSPSNASLAHVAFMAHLEASRPVFSFVHYRDPDSAGHASGWGSAAWNNAVQSVDAYLGEILDYVDANPGLLGRTVILVTADHGGVGTDHSNPTYVWDYTIPFFAWGTDVPAGGDLYAMNTGRRLDPGTARPDYNTHVPPIRNGDSGNLILSLLGLPAIPGSSINAAQDLLVTPPVSAVGETIGASLEVVSAYPNPFNGRTVLAYELNRQEDVRLAVFDVSGSLVRTLVKGARDRGMHEAAWDGRNNTGGEVPSGVYFYLLETRNTRLTGKITFVK